MDLTELTSSLLSNRLILLHDKGTFDNWFVADVNVSALAGSLFYEYEDSKLTQLLILCEYLTKDVPIANKHDEFIKLIGIDEEIPEIQKFYKDFNRNKLDFNDPYDISRLVVKAQAEFEKLYPNQQNLAIRSGEFFDNVTFDTVVGTTKGYITDYLKDIK